MKILTGTTNKSVVFVLATMAATISQFQETLAFTSGSRFPTASPTNTMAPVSSLRSAATQGPPTSPLTKAAGSSISLARRLSAKMYRENDYDRQPQQPQQQQQQPLRTVSKWMTQFVLAATLVLFGGSSSSSTGNSWLSNHALVPPPANAFEGAKVVGKLAGSGIVFKDSLQIERFEDPKVKGVVLYISNFDRPITEKLGGNFFNDPAYASVACAKTGKELAIADTIAKGPQGEEVFEESRSLLFKTLRVQRIYDTETNTVVYVSYNTRFDKSDDSNKSRFKSSLCAVNLNDT